MAVGAAAGIQFTGSEGGFLPPSLTGCALWLRADMGITSPDAGIARWLDKSASLFHMSQDTAVQKPARYSTVGNALDFDGVNNFLTGSPVPGVGGATTVGIALQALVDNAGGAAGRYFLNSGLPGTDGILGWYSNGAPSKVYFTTYAGVAAHLAWHAATTNPETLVWRHDGAGGNADLCINGAHEATQAQAQANNATTYTGIGAGGGGQSDANVRFWALIIYDTRLSDADTLLLNTYLTNLRNGTPAGSPPGVPVLWLERPDQWAGPSVSAWADQSGVTVYDFAQNTVADYPVLCLGDKSTPFLHFDGASDHLFRTTIASWASPYTAAIVTKVDAFSGSDCPFGAGDPGGPNGWRVEMLDTPPLQVRMSHAGAAAGAYENVEVRLNRIIYRHSAGQIGLDLNGTPIASAALLADLTPHTVTDVVGGRTAGGSALQLIEGRVYEVAGYSVDVGAGSVQLAEYLTSRYALNPNFVPTDIEDCGLWLRADLGVTTDGEGISRWVDKADSALFAEQTTTAHKPVVAGTALRTDGVATHLDLPTYTGLAGANTIGIAHRILSDYSGAASSPIAGCFGTPNANGCYYAVTNHTPSRRRMVYCTGVAGVGDWGDATTAKETWIARHDGAGGNADMAIDGAHQVTKAIPQCVVPAGGGAIGGRTGGTVPVNADLYCLIGYSDRKSDAVVANMHAYMSAVMNGTALPTWRPTDEANLEFWFEHADLYAGENVSAWANQGSLGGSFTMGTVTARPVLLPGASNGLPSMHYDDSNDRLTYTGLGPDFTYLHDGLGMTTMVVGAFNANGCMLDTCKDLAASVGANFEYFATGRQRINISDGSGAYIVASIGWAGEWPLNEYRAALWRAQTDAPLEYETRVDGSVVRSGAFLAPANTAAPAFKLTIGNLNNGGQGAGGFIPEVISHTRYLSQSECADLESYANRRYAI